LLFHRYTTHNEIDTLSLPTLFRSRYGAFPVPKYELLGKESFKGVGNGGNFSGIDVDGKKILYSYFFVNKNSFTQKFVGDKPNERSEEHTSELQSRENLVCRLLLEK